MTMTSQALNREQIQVQREGTRVWLEGVPPSQSRWGNGYIAGLQTVLNCCGEPISYDRLMGLSGMAFINQVDAEHRWQGDVDPGWWPLDPWGLKLRRQFLAEAVGHELVGLGWFYDSHRWPFGKPEALRSLYSERIKAGLVREIEAGRPALTTYCPTPPEFGYVKVGYDDDTGDASPIWGRCANDDEGNCGRCADWPFGVLVVGKAAKTLDRDVADVRALRFAVKLGRDEAGPYAAAYRDRRFTGQKGFAAWAALLRDPNEQFTNHGQANVKRNLIANRKAAAAFLREAAARRIDEPASVTLREAAEEYERVIELSEQFSAKGLSANPELRKDMAELVDRIAEVERHATDLMERATQQMAVKRENGRVLITDAPRPWRSCSSLAVLTALLQHRGEDVSYTYLMGVGSRAFRFQFSWCPSAPHAYVGFNTFEPALKAMGYECKQWAGSYSFLQKPATQSTEAQREQTRIAIKAAIDAGETVMFGSEEDGLLVGYEPVSEENPTGWLCRPGPLGPPPPEDEPYCQPIKNLPWGFGTLKRVGKPMPRDEAAKWAIQMAVVNARRGTVEGEDLKTGFAAWQKWIDELHPDAFAAVIRAAEEQAEAAGKKDANPLPGHTLGNAWCYENLYFARYEAARYLREIADDLPEAVRPHLLLAADEYEKVHHALVPEGDCSTKIAPYPWMLKNVGGEWTDAMRQRQADLLRDALPHERAPVEALARALDAMGIKVEIAGATR